MKMRVRNEKSRYRVAGSILCRVCAGFKILRFALIVSCCLVSAVFATALAPPLLDAEHPPENLTADQLYARSAILIDQDTGRVLFEKNADQRMYPASTTKIMTLMLALEYGPMGKTVTVPKEAAQIPGPR